MCYSLRRVVSHQSLHVSSGSSLLGHVLLWIRGSWFWRKGLGGWREETLWGISYPLACEPDEMRGTDLDATLGLLPRIVCQEVVIMPRLDLWSPTAPVTVVLYAWLLLSVALSISSLFFLPWPLPLFTPSTLMLFLSVTHLIPLNSLSICHFLPYLQMCIPFGLLSLVHFLFHSIFLWVIHIVSLPVL